MGNLFPFLGLSSKEVGLGNSYLKRKGRTEGAFFGG